MKQQIGFQPNYNEYESINRLALPASNNVYK